MMNPGVKSDEKSEQQENSKWKKEIFKHVSENKRKWRNLIEMNKKMMNCLTRNRYKGR